MSTRTTFSVVGLSVCLCLTATGLTPAARTQAPAVSGQAIYTKYCASCHDQVNSRIPAREVLTRMSPARILRTLDFGLMMSIASPLKRDQREAVAKFLGTGSEEEGPPADAFCGPDRPILSGPDQNSWSSWSPSEPNNRFQTAERAGLAASDVPKLKLKWAFGLAGDVTAFAAPVIVNGTLFVGSAAGGVQALDARTGCLYWRFQANGPVRAAPTVATEGARQTLVFGDQNGWVYAVDARSGTLNWKKRVEAHEATRLTASLAVHDGVAFVPAASWEETRSIDPAYPCCTFRGSVTAVRIRDGSIAWKRYLVDPPRRTGATSSGTATFGPSGVGIWAVPTIDRARGVLYVATGDNYSHPATATSDAIIALNLRTGRIVWSRQMTTGDVYNSSCPTEGANCPAQRGPDYDFGSPAMLLKTTAARDVLVAGQKSGVVYALDPANNGQLIWQARVGNGGTNGGIQWGLAADEQRVYAAVSDVVRLENVGGVVPVGNASLDPVKGGGLTALSLQDGATIWSAPSAPCVPPRSGCSPAQPGAVTLIPGAVFSGSMDGHIRAFSTVDGKLLWDFDTVRSYTTVNGASAKGGSLDGSGPVIAGGLVFVNSGYPRFGGTPGNVLLAFTVEP